MVRIVRCFTVATALLTMVCNNGDDGKCSGPSIKNCSGSPCQYTCVYNADGDFVGEFSGNVWNGKDCRGNEQDCGVYTFETHVVYAGQENTVTHKSLYARSTGVTKFGQAACDSLKNGCSGKYAELMSSGIVGNSIVEDVGCVCCQE